MAFNRQRQRPYRSDVVGNDVALNPVAACRATLQSAVAISKTTRNPIDLQLGNNRKNAGATCLFKAIQPVDNIAG